MLRFNIHGIVKVDAADYKFQYILCYGSTIGRISNPSLPKEFQYILCYGSTIGVM